MHYFLYMSKKLIIIPFVLLQLVAFSDEPATLAIGSKAIDFSLPGVDGKNHSLGDFDAYKYLVIIFTCDHCPTAQAYENKIIRIVKSYRPEKVGFVAISPNSPKALCIEEMGYSDLGDELKDMKIRAEEMNFNFPYLYDGDLQQVSRSYGPKATPHVFVFDENRILRYSGRIDNTENPYIKPSENDLTDALDALITGKEVAVKETKTFGCSIKWEEKSKWKNKLDADWAAKPVNLEPIDVAGIRDLLSNNTDKLLMVNVWATWCGPCIIEYPSLVYTYRMYLNRDFRFVSISADKPTIQDKVLAFLQEKQSAIPNYIFEIADKYKLIDAIGNDWSGNLPVTLLIEPGGEVLKKYNGAVEPFELRSDIIRYLGRYYADDK